MYVTIIPAMILSLILLDNPVILESLLLEPFTSIATYQITLIEIMLDSKLCVDFM